MENLFEQFGNINKAHGYDILSSQLSEIKISLQSVYDHYIQLSDTAFDNSQNPVIKDSIGPNWYDKSQAYEWCANVLIQNAALASVFLQTKKTKRQLFVDSERQQETHETTIDLNYREEVYE